MSIKRVYLTNGQNYQLYKWLDKNKKRAAQLTAAQLLVAAREKFDFPVKESHINKGRVELGIKVKHGGSGKPLASRLMILSEVVVALHKKLGEEVPVELQAMMAK